jgi:hypothetical protein
MDDFNVSSLHESRNEWCARLLTILTPLIIEGYKSIFEESIKLCKANDELDKYLMTFQNLIARIPKWNKTIIEQEKERIIKRSSCTYLEELVTCVHIIQLKLLTAMRVGQKQKKIDINIPRLEDFIHKAYINVARKIYKNVYLFEINIAPLQTQKNNRELEIIVQECILNTIRDSIPIENILRAYMDETVEEDVVEEIKEEIIEPEINKEQEGKEIKEVEEKNNNSNIITNNILDNTDKQSLKFNDIDSVIDTNNEKQLIEAPKTIERLEEISTIRNNQRKLEDHEDDDNEDKLIISDDLVSLGDLDIHVIDNPQEKNKSVDDDFLLDDIEILT